MVESVPDGSLDVLFIDGNHYYGPAFLDACVWLRKVKYPEGAIVFNDYDHISWPDVKRVVDTFAAHAGASVRMMDGTNAFILASEMNLVGVKRLCDSRVHAGYLYLSSTE